jgi:predicted nucleic acid-binding protein
MAGVFAIDSSCMIAAVCSWHEHHEVVAAAIEDCFERGEQLSIAGHALAEAYAVLTRLPSPYRLAPADAWALIEGNFVKAGNVIGLTGGQYKALLRTLVKTAIAGGRTYDAIIAEGARRAGARTLLTLNPRHFDPPPSGVAIVVPA